MTAGKRTQIWLVLGAAFLVIIGLSVTPENLLRLEIMENALESDDHLIRTGARIEIATVRILSLVLGGGMLLLVPFWPRICASQGYRAFLDYRRPHHREYRAFRGRFHNPSLVAILIGLALVAIYMLTADSLLTPAQMLAVQREDGLIEGLSAVLLLAASIMSLGIARRLGRHRPGFAMHLFLAFLFFVMCGEEISWGQRQLGIETPEALARINVQNETNFHNIYGYFFDHMFIFCFFVWGVVVPLLNRYTLLFRQFFARIGLPVPSAGLGLGMLLISLMQSVIVHQFIAPFDSSLPRLRLPEPRELLSALAFLLLMLETRKLVTRWPPETSAARRLALEREKARAR